MADHNDARTQALSAAIEKLSLEVSESLAEQRRYTEEAYVTLDSKMDSGFRRLDSTMDAGFARLEGQMDSGFTRLERKLDQFIDTQIQTNQIVDRRLRVVEE